MRTQRNIGMLLLGIWLILTGILPFLKITFPSLGVILAAIAVLAGIFILMGR